MTGALLTALWCGGCKRYFESVRPYDLHAFPEGCGTDKQLASRGLYVDTRGVWLLP